MLAETGIDRLEGGLELPRHGDIQLANNRAQMQGRLLHIRDLR